ncbi:MAG TPA: hypothetical protein VEF04_18575, partial [Blastocatellia bacterium]|nr:hypothetical protein [Blastocatellia bacterium]
LMMFELTRRRSEHNIRITFPPVEIGNGNEGGQVPVSATNLKTNLSAFASIQSYPQRTVI